MSDDMEQGTSDVGTPVHDDVQMGWFEDGSTQGVDGSTRPALGEHEGRFYRTATVAAGANLSDKQQADAAEETRLTARNSGFEPIDNSFEAEHYAGLPDADNQTVVISVPVRPNTVRTGEQTGPGTHDAEGAPVVQERLDQSAFAIGD